jgi:general stress protein CsbA
MVVGVVGWMETLFINIVHVHSLTIRKVYLRDSRKKNTNNEWKKVIFPNEWKKINNEWKKNNKWKKIYALFYCCLLLINSG